MSKPFDITGIETPSKVYEVVTQHALNEDVRGQAMKYLMAMQSLYEHENYSDIAFEECQGSAVLGSEIYPVKYIKITLKNGNQLTHALKFVLSKDCQIITQCELLNAEQFIHELSLQ